MSNWPDLLEEGERVDADSKALEFRAVDDSVFRYRRHSWTFPGWLKCVRGGKIHTFILA